MAQVGYPSRALGTPGSRGSTSARSSSLALATSGLLVAAGAPWHPSIVNRPVDEVVRFWGAWTAFHVIAVAAIILALVGAAGLVGAHGGRLGHLGQVGP